MLKKIIPFITAMALLVTMFTIPASAFKPVVEENDIGWFLGYDPSTKHVVIDSHNDGIKVTFNYLGQGQYWSDRVTLGRYYDLTDTDSKNLGAKPSNEGIYFHLKDIQWDAPAATPAVKKPVTGLAFGFGSGIGLWCDCNCLIFRIRRDNKGNCEYSVMDCETKKDDNVFTETDWYPLKYNITNDLHVWLRRENNSKWALNLNNNRIEIPDSVLKQNVPTLVQGGCCIGTWDINATVSFVCDELWGYGLYQYKANTPPSFVKQVRSGNIKSYTIGDTSKGFDLNATISSNPSKSNESPNNTGSVKPNIGKTTSGDTSINTSSNNSELQSNIDEDNSEQSNITDNENDGSTSEYKSDSNKNTTAPTKGGVNKILVGILIGLILLVVAGVGVAYYFMFIKKKEIPEDTKKE